MDKNNLRIMCKNKRESIKNRHDKALAVLENLKGIKSINNAKVVGLYSSFKGEVETEGIFYYLKSVGIKIAYPKVINKNLMKFYFVEDLRELVEGTYGILEPNSEREVEPDVVIIPGLAFSLHMDRLGYGGGYYDRYLEGREVLKIGLCYEDLILENIEADEHDVKMDYVVTESKIYKK